MIWKKKKKFNERHFGLYINISKLKVIFYNEINNIFVFQNNYYYWILAY